VLSTNRLLAFYRRQSRDDRGRTLDQVRALDLRELERVHDYIQWLFPLPEPSGANPVAPVLTPDAITAFRSDDALHRDLLESFVVMLRFYGFRLARDPTRIERAPNFEARVAEWLRPGNHNFLRLTRIMRSLTVLGLPDCARGLLGQLEQLYSEHPQIIGGRTIDFWRRAVG
jgi:Opioid growth factor receptor (OGFr) conserved region